MSQAGRSLKRDQMSNSSAARERVESLYAEKSGSRRQHLDRVADCSVALTADHDTSDRDVLSGVVADLHARWREFGESLVQAISFNVCLLFQINFYVVEFEFNLCIFNTS